ncbi:hypothetical protein [Pseudomonas rhizosphaerae]|jgi:hypothetical protein|uniref:PilZ domain-containing protein n=1 Tax=Pseudomonas rhizosphaerae TaxID=216142 RepID=A0A089YT60_9PSED|nr:hypothetical protein [Pseudomonas rhizosphaerae]AIS19623.1 hypothetical protein LT40_20405 [Pseudomonas rhizosphaerae]MBD8616289.1 hypothetical protein [Pseudomonas putida]MEB2871701.1 hypothetical protein [Pseudomonas rhizosphaerae]
MPPDVLLTQDELDFLRAMQANPQLNVRDTLLSLSVKGGPQVRELLMRLASHEQVTIEAHLENQQISFPLQVVEDEFQAAHLELGAPSIYEDGPMLRPWRLSLAQPIVLRDSEGRDSDFWVRDISFKGALLEARNGAQAPTQFQLWFTPEGCSPIPLRGSMIREAEQGLFAYRLSQNNAKAIESLRQFILQQHHLVHPQPHT